ncbi:hypothetical protein A3860_16460 [Niastella vici]|uniref:Lipoprotein n=1 Tax=Niastella vici TaxID=1703345 RepID=A0A1V9G3W5_9BACT|nr:hypothetical protein [Niastella vici]OQP65262.1 hypothetical protein A3860_16460 [Niastella vici]
MKYLIILPVFLVIFYSCSNSTKPAPVSATTPDAAGAVINTKEELPIKDFIKKFKVVPFPFYYLGWARNEYYRNQSFKLKKNSTDTLFFKMEPDAPVYGYALLADTSKFYSLIYFGTGEEIYPILVTYSKTGRQLSQETLLVHGCGSDCGLKYCSYTAQIDKDLRVYIADTLKYDGMCDSTGNYKPDSDSTFVFAKRGQVDEAGTIKLGEEATQSFKGIR